MLYQLTWYNCFKAVMISSGTQDISYDFRAESQKSHKEPEVKVADSCK